MPIRFIKSIPESFSTNLINTCVPSSKTIVCISKIRQNICKDEVNIMLEENKTVELKEEDLEKVFGGVNRVFATYDEAKCEYCDNLAIWDCDGHYACNIHKMTLYNDYK